MLPNNLLNNKPELSGEDLCNLVKALWTKSVHERRMCAVVLLDLCSNLLGPCDLPIIEHLIKDSHTWAYVDMLAGDIAGSILFRKPSNMSYLDRWATSSNFWLRRSALLALMKPLKKGAAFRRFGRYANEMLEEKEFFIRKAIGWVLRETSKTRPDEVYKWLQPRAHRASGITIREAVKYLSTQERAQILQAFKGGT